MVKAASRWVWLVVAAASCAEDPNAAPTAGLAIVSGDGVVDTAAALLGTPLVIEVRDDNLQPVAGALVHFDGAAIGTNDYGTYVSIRPEGPYTASLVQPTTAVGRVGVFVRFGTHAGPETLTVSVPDDNLVADAAFDITPGAPAVIVAAPPDTAVFIGGSYRIRAAVFDQFGNQRTDRVTYSPRASVVAVDSAGLVTGSRFGRTAIALSAASLTDSVWTSVVPAGSIAAIKTRAGADAGALIAMNLDGSNYREIQVDPTGLYPEWLSDSEVVVSDGDWFQGAPINLFVVASDGAMRRVTDTTAGFSGEFWAQQDVPGGWVYFAGFIPGQGSAKIWRVRANGADLMQVGPGGFPFDNDLQPSPSRDGLHVVFATNRNRDYALTLWTIDLQTMIVDTLMEPGGLSVPGSHPRWSPDGTVIGYMWPTPGYQSDAANTIYVIRPDGTGRRAVTPSTRAYQSPFDWSPDGRWLVARSYDTVALFVIEAATGQAVPLPYTERLIQPTWR